MKRKKARSAKTVKAKSRTARAGRKPLSKAKRVVKKKAAPARKAKAQGTRAQRQPPGEEKSIARQEAAPAEEAKTQPVPEQRKAPSQAAEASPKKGTAATPLLRIPPILFEGDQPAAPVATGPGRKYEVSPEPAPEAEAPELELPAAYGTGTLRLTARDPHWLYAEWDLTDQQQRHYNALSADHHLVIRVTQPERPEQATAEAHVHPESRHWFVHVPAADTRYQAELGYYQPNRQWVTITGSSMAITPPEGVAEDKTERWVTVPPPAPAAPPAAPAEPARERPTGFIETGMRQELKIELPRPPAPAPEFSRLEREEVRASVERRTEAPVRMQFPEARPEPPPAWTAARERALAQVIGMALLRHRPIGSEEIAELIRKGGERMLPAEALRAEAAPSGAAVTQEAAVTGISSPAGGEQARPGKFWFNINAEVVIYGATEPDAQVTIDGRPIRLRPDGTFSYRYALPDGQYQLAAIARSAAADQRSARLSFGRHSEYGGEVGAHPQSEELNTAQRA